jgi:alpha-glucosidase (family GH31 glycosyl hydrolase)
VYFPAKSIWYTFQTGALTIDTSFNEDSSVGSYLNLPTSLTEVQVHIAGGNILPMQQPAMTTTAGRETPFTLYIALNRQGEAKGHLFWDDGEQLELINYLEVE